ncbi:MAG: cell division protein FtsA [Alistipes sp.]|nr:cell division protein FtsA [Alistipes sp.]
MKGKQIVAIDVGSTNVVIAVASVEEDGRVDIRGIVTEPIEGINAGRVENIETAGSAVKSAKERIEKMLGISITEAYAGLSGDFIRCVPVTDHVYVQDEMGNGSNQITQRDLDDLDRRMRSVTLPDDREEIIMMEPLRYTIDEKEVTVPVGAYGYLLAATYNFVLCDRAMRDRLRQCLQRQGISVKEFVPNALISHLAVATTEDIEEGCVVIDLGGGVTDVAVLLGGKVRHIASIPIGTNSVNGDIRAYGIPANYIESLKCRYGSAMRDMATEDKIVFQSARRGTTKSIMRRNLAAIIEARLVEILEWVRREIKNAGCGKEFKPVVLVTGGGAEMQHIEELFARELGVEEVRAVYPEYGFTETMSEHISTTAYATAASLLIYGAKHGSCSIAVRVAQPESVVQTPRTAAQPAPQSAAPKQSHNIEPVHDTEDEEDNTYNDTDTDDVDIEIDQPKKGKKIKESIRTIFTKLSNSFTNNGDEDDYEY